MTLKFLELAIAAPAVLESYQFYERRGFRPGEVVLYRFGRES